MADSALRRNRCAGEGEYLFLHGNIQRAVAIHFEVEGHVFHRIAAETQRHITHRQLDAVQTGGVSQGIGAALRVDRHARDRFAAGRIAHRAAHESPAAAGVILFSDFVNLVLEGRDLGGVIAVNHLGLFRGPTVFKITGRKGLHEVTAPEDKPFPIVISYRITVCAQLRERLLPERISLFLNSIAMLIRGIAHKIDGQAEGVAQIGGQRICIHAVNAAMRFRTGILRAERKCGCRQQKGKNQGKTFHRNLSPISTARCANSHSVNMRFAGSAASIARSITLRCVLYRL